MIFITVGSQDKPFTRLFDEVVELINKKIIDDEVIAQVGCNKIKSKTFKTYDLLNSKDYEKILNNCDLVITHGGVGTIIDALKKNKKVIAIPRKKEYKECANNHQFQIVEAFSNQGYILGINELTELEDAIKKSKRFTPKKLIINNRLMIDTISNYIDSL